MHTTDLAMDPFHIQAVTLVWLYRTVSKELEVFCCKPPIPGPQYHPRPHAQFPWGGLPALSQKKKIGGFTLGTHSQSRMSTPSPHGPCHSCPSEEGHSVLKGNKQKQAHFQLETVTLPCTFPMHTNKQLRSEEPPSTFPNSHLCPI